MSDSFSHIDKNNQPKMVNVGEKSISKRKATAYALMFLGEEIISHFKGEELKTKKGPVFQTAIIAGIQAVKKTWDVIPMCHPLPINGVEINIEVTDEAHIKIFCTVHTEGKTGIEMEALHGVSISALTVYDMCKALSQKMVIKEIKLLKKTGGKSDYRLKENENEES
ncbi:MAG: cyclic pyranopterin monophosphate synthase MoaC [Lutimonas sp.]